MAISRTARKTAARARRGSASRTSPAGFTFSNPTMEMAVLAQKNGFITLKDLSHFLADNAKPPTLLIQAVLQGVGELALEAIKNRIDSGIDPEVSSATLEILRARSLIKGDKVPGHWKYRGIDAGYQARVPLHRPFRRGKGKNLKESFQLFMLADGSMFIGIPSKKDHPDLGIPMWKIAKNQETGYTMLMTTRRARFFRILSKALGKSLDANTKAKPALVVPPRPILVAAEELINGPERKRVVSVMEQSWLTEMRRQNPKLGKLVKKDGPNPLTSGNIPPSPLERLGTVGKVVKVFRGLSNLVIRGVRRFTG